MRHLPAKYDLTAMSQSAEETNDPLIADHRNFYKGYARIRAPTFPTFDSPPAATSCNRNKIISSL